MKQILKKTLFIYFTNIFKFKIKEGVVGETYGFPTTLVKHK